jgi:hypothetical protein
VLREFGLINEEGNKRQDADDERHKNLIGLPGVCGATPGHGEHEHGSGFNHKEVATVKDNEYGKTNKKR